jgi:transcriptional regulator with XRE-family HTH domain
MKPDALMRDTVSVPPKIPRPPGPDEWAAARVRHERELRGWSTAELARRVTEAGVPLRQQQVWQIESGTPPRRLSVGEAATIARIFGISLFDLMTPPEEVASQNLVNLGRDFAAWRRDAGLLAARLREIDERASQLVRGDDESFTATTVVKFGGYGDVSEQTAAEFEEIAASYSAIAQAVRDHASVWSVIASMRELATLDDAAKRPESGGGDEH